MPISKRKLVTHLGALSLYGSTLGFGSQAWGTSHTKPLFPVSLAQWSLHRTYFGDSLKPDFFRNFLKDPDSVLNGEADPLDFPLLAREAFDISAVEYVNTFYFSRARDDAHFAELKRRADGEGVRSLLIMCDALGNTGDQSEQTRKQSVENHKPWLQAAAGLGCHAIRVNAAGQGGREEVANRVAESLHALGDLATPLGLSVLVENHGGYSSDGAWLAETIRRADHDAVGTLPDFGNFQISPRGEAPIVTYDRYRGTEELMSQARAVSAKSYDFDDSGDETTIDYRRMLQIVADAGYRGFVGVEYEGQRLSEFDGIRATRDLILRIGAELSARTSATQ